MLFILFTRRHVISVSTWSRVYNSPLLFVSRMAEFRPDAHKHTHSETRARTHTGEHAPTSGQNWA